ncbi:hypothetical protein BSZ39_08600 [Bowdeniella nasicola]|uniref:Uncharacterized protein n=1 Tax=Bowdeniella nasicola TaxID=208480 RepID=A0A1Q5Q165_9ACTO|nr:hypothetical protein [Bowdeniella nasicola]OKL53604.1 hypothetical protein BSZ39_08600 [Bowdeniella nasicola]
MAIGSKSCVEGAITVGLVAANIRPCPESRAVWRTVPSVVDTFHSFGTSFGLDGRNRASVSFHPLASHPMVVVRDPWGNRHYFIEGTPKVELIHTLPLEASLSIPPSEAMERALATAPAWCGPLLSPDSPHCTLAIDDREGGVAVVRDADGRELRRGVTAWRDRTAIGLYFPAGATHGAVYLYVTFAQSDSGDGCEATFALSMSGVDTAAATATAATVWESLKQALDASDTTVRAAESGSSASSPVRSTDDAAAAATTIRDFLTTTVRALDFDEAMDLVAQCLGYAAASETAESLADASSPLPLVRASHPAFPAESSADFDTVGTPTNRVVVSSEIGSRGAIVLMGLPEPTREPDHLWDDSDNLFLVYCDAE